MLTLDEIGQLGAALRGGCFDRGVALDAFLAKNPHLDSADVCGTGVLIGRVPFPSIDGSPPVYRHRPYFNARHFERLDALIDREDLI